jgi:hypothetical protein
MPFLVGNYSNGYPSKEVMSYANRSFTDADTTYAPRAESIYAQSQFLEAERLSQVFPEYWLYKSLVSTMPGDKSTKVIRVPTAIGTPRIQKLTQGHKNIYRTGSGADGDTAPVPTWDSAVQTIYQTKVGNEYSTPFTGMEHIGIIGKDAYTTLMLPGAMQSPTWGEAEIVAGDVVGANVYFPGDSAQWMDSPAKILSEFAQNGIQALEFYRNTGVLFAILASGVITTTAGAYGGNESLGKNNQISGGAGYTEISLFNPASISGAFAGLYKATPTTNGIQLNAAGSAMTGTRRIAGKNVPTSIVGAGVGTTGANGPITNDELRNLATFRQGRFGSKDKYAFFVDPVVGLNQIKSIPEVRAMALNNKALDYNQENDWGIGAVTPHGFDVRTCPSLLPMNGRYTGLFIPTAGKKPVRSILTESPNTREISLPFSDPKRPNYCYRFSMQEGFGVLEPGKIAVVYYQATA